MRSIKKLVCIAFATTLVTGCNSGSSSKSHVNIDGSKSSYAIINTLAPDYSDANLVIVEVDDDSLVANEGNYFTGLSDFTIAAHGEYFYRLGRYQMDSITKYSIKNPNDPIYIYSTLDNDSDSNPTDLISISDSKAYLLRYGSKYLWEVDPSAEQESGFITDKIDLSDYSVGDDIPEMSAGVLIDNKLYITLQNLDETLHPQNQAKVIVLNTETNEVEKEIKLKTDNPTDIQYSKELNALFIVSPGRSIAWPESHEDSGIEKIDLLTYSTEITLAGTEEFSISELAIKTPTQAYVSLYYGWEDSTVFTLDLNSGVTNTELDSAVSNTGILGLSIIDNKLWVSVTDASPYVGIYDINSNKLEQRIMTDFNPEKVVFVKK